MQTETKGRLRRAGVVLSVMLLVGAVVAAGPMAQSAQAFAPSPIAPLPTVPAPVLVGAGDAATGATVAGAGGALATGFAVGTGVLAAAAGAFTVGATGVKYLWKPITGGDLAETVCVGGTGGQILGLLYGQDCSARLASSSAPGYVPNGDTATSPDLSVWIGSKSCAISGDASRCGTVYQIARTTGTGTQWAYGCVWLSSTLGSNGSIGGHFPAVGASYGGSSPQSTPPTSTGWDSSCGTVGGAAQYGYVPLWGSSVGVADNWHVSQGLWTGTVSSVTVPQTHANPARSITCEVIGSDGQSYQKVGGTFTEADGDLLAAMAKAVSCPTLPTGTTPSEFRLTENAVDGSVPPKVIQDQHVSDAYAQHVAAQPDCADAACFYQIAKRAGTGWVPCTVGDSECADWFSTTTKQDDFECIDGPPAQPFEYVNPLADCNELSKYYQPQRQASGGAYTDPSTGLATGTITSPDADQSQMNQPAADSDADGQNRACWPSGWGAINPLNWVLQPLQCFARWAFVPKPQTLGQVEEQISDAWEQSAPGEVVNVALPAYVVPAFSSTGCDGPEIHIRLAFWQGLGGAMSWLDGVPAVDYDGHPLSACTDPMKTMATWCVLLSSAALLWGGGFAVMRQIGGIVGSRGLGGSGD